MTKTKAFNNPAQDPALNPTLNPAQVFDRTALRRNRDRAAPGFKDHDFLVREVADRLHDKYYTISQKSQDRQRGGNS